MNNFISPLAHGAWLLALLLLAAPPAGAQPAGRNVIVEVKGQVKVKRGEQNDVPAAYGMEVVRGDLLDLAPGARLTLVCADKTLKTVTETSNVPCASEGSRGMVGTLLPSRAVPLDQVPLILAPRATKLLDARPMLRWTSVPGVRIYKLTIKDMRARKPHWSTTVTGKTKLAYPRNAPALVPGTPYLLQVEADGRSSDEEGTRESSFSVLESSAAAPIRQTASRLASLGLKLETRQLLVAFLYVDHGLFTEAIAQLEAQPPAKREAAVSRLLSKAYLHIALSRQAEEHAQHALEQSRSKGDLEGQLEAEEALAQIYGALGNPAERTRRLEAALELSLQINDAKKITQLRQELLVKVP